MTSFRRYLQSRNLPEWKEMNEYIYVPSKPLSQFIHNTLSLFDFKNMFTDEDNTPPISVWFAHQIFVIHMGNSSNKQQIKYTPCEEVLVDDFSNMMKGAGVRCMNITLDDDLRELFKCDSFTNYEFFYRIQPHLSPAKPMTIAENNMMVKLYEDMYTLFEKLELEEIKKRNN